LQRNATLETEEALLEVRLKAVQLELEEKRLEKQALNRTATDLTVQLASGRSHMGELRGVDKK
jgi:circadian clock protein KaiC